MPTQTGGSGDDIIVAPQAEPQLVSTDANGAAGDETSVVVSVSSDGKWIVFGSWATNLVPGDTNGQADIFIKNTETGEITRVMGLGGAEPDGPSLWSNGFTPDGTKFIFDSAATNLVVGDTNGYSDSFSYDLATGVVTRLSMDAAGNEFTNWSFFAEITLTPDGTKAVGLVGGPYFGTSTNQLAVRDLATGAYTILSTTSAGAILPDYVIGYSLSPDGTQALFTTEARQSPSDDDDDIDIFIVNIATGTVQEIALDTANWDSQDYLSPVFAADGQSFYFVSGDSELVSDDTNDSTDIFSYNLTTHQITRLTVGGVEFDRGAAGPTVSADGRWLSFSSNSNNVVANDADNDRDLFVMNLATGEIIKIGNVTHERFSADGDWLVYASSTALSPDDVNGVGDIYRQYLIREEYNLSGGAGTDLLSGGVLADIIDGGQGDDTLVGGGGDDLLGGGAGSDAMAGGTGDDTYIVTDAGDTVDETGGSGTDLVRASVSFVLPTDVENLTLLYGQPLNGTGNASANVITGNSGGNTLSGLGGEDTLNGGSGADTLYGGDDNDTIDGGAGDDSLYGEAGDDDLSGGAGRDRLDGGTGADRMEGGGSGDTYVVDDSGDVIVETDTGTDYVEAWTTYTLAANVENMTLMGASAIDATGNGDKNTLTGNGAANTLTGGAGDDTLSGLGGSDVLIGGAGADKLTGGTGADIFRFSNADVGASLVVDRITDFSFADGDVIDLSGLNGAFAQIQLVTAFTGVAGQAKLTISGSNTLINIDLDGNGTIDYRIEVNGDLRGTGTNLYEGAGDLNGGWLL